MISFKFIGTGENDDDDDDEESSSPSSSKQWNSKNKASRFLNFEINSRTLVVVLSAKVDLPKMSLRMDDEIGPVVRHEAPNGEGYQRCKIKS